MKKGWFGGGIWKPKNPHSLEHLRYLFTIISKNQVVNDNNRSILVESLRSIAEILIWGDQNDSSVFDFFLEKNMLSFFLRIMKQKCGSNVCVQLLQTLNILFENIRNETSLYFLLSNNHVNSIIVHKFDFSDEEVMAYYISFVKTLSFKLNVHTIHFFYNEHTNDFPLYTEAIKFFNHPESMVRIAVRILTLNVYRVDDCSMRQFIRDKTAAPYFSNLVWFIGNHILELDSCLRDDVDHSSRDKLTDLVAENLDHLHYLNDILKLNVTELNLVLSHHLINRLLVPLLVYSLNRSNLQEGKPYVSRVVALFMLSQIFLIFSFSPLMQVLSRIILHGDSSVFAQNSVLECPSFIAPEEPLEKSLRSREESSEDEDGASELHASRELNSRDNLSPDGSDGISLLKATHVNITDEEKERLKTFDLSMPTVTIVNPMMESLSSRPFLLSIFDGLDCSENDYNALFSLCLLYAIGHNSGINKTLLALGLGLQENGKVHFYYSPKLIEQLLKIVSQSAQLNSKIRVATLEMCLNVLKTFFNMANIPTAEDSEPCNKDYQLAAIEGAKEEATLLLRNYYKGEEIFLDMFEDEWRELNRRPLNVEYLLQDASILLPPTGTPLTGINFNKRLPCGEVEKARRSMRVYFLIRATCLSLKEEMDPHLPLTNPAACVQEFDVLDLNNSDLIACVVITRDSQRSRRFLVIDIIQLILVEPDQRRLGWGVAKFVGFLQDLEVMGDKDDSRVLHITIHRPSAVSGSSGRPTAPLLAAKFIFDDHIRCMAAKQRLTKGKNKARQRKLHQIARLLELPSNLQPCPSPPVHSLSTMRQDAQRRNCLRPTSENRSRTYNQRNKYFTDSAKGPGVALKRENTSEVKSESGTESSTRSSSRNAYRSASRSRNEEVPLEDLSSSYKGDDSSRIPPSSTSFIPISPSSKETSQYVNVGSTALTVMSVAEQVPYRGSCTSTERYPTGRSVYLPSESTSANSRSEAGGYSVNNCDNSSLNSADSSRISNKKPAKKIEIV